MDDYENYQQRKQKIYQMWKDGAKRKEIAQFADVSLKRASQIAAKFLRQEKETKRRDAKERMQSAVLCLQDNGYTPEEIALFFDLEILEFERMKSDAEIKTGRTEPHWAHFIEVSVRAMNTLEKLGASTLEDVCAISEAELQSTKGCGKGTIEEIKAALAKNGRSLSP